ncbi:hypothetical protein LCGC14_1745020 [marine sediment metagenome]|uniref:Uncharacterized protein n=1 Tax=marine sediment metagenome TaxID=412755 RepID=A0A0F9HT72_9ZZZZ
MCAVQGHPCGIAGTTSADAEHRHSVTSWTRPFSMSHRTSPRWNSSAKLLENTRLRIRPCLVFLLSAVNRYAQLTYSLLSACVLLKRHPRLVRFIRGGLDPSRQMQRRVFCALANVRSRSVRKGITDQGALQTSSPDRRRRRRFLRGPTHDATVLTDGIMN